MEGHVESDGPVRHSNSVIDAGGAACSTRTAAPRCRSVVDPARPQDGGNGVHHLLIEHRPRGRARRLACRRSFMHLRAHRTRSHFIGSPTGLAALPDSEAREPSSLCRGLLDRRFSLTPNSGAGVDNDAACVGAGSLELPVVHQRHQAASAGPRQRAATTPKAVSFDGRDDMRLHRRDRPTPSSASRAVIAIAGDSRRSSTSALNASPRHAMTGSSSRAASSSPAPPPPRACRHSPPRLTHDFVCSGADD